MSNPDSRLDTEALLANVDWVRVLARGLVSDPHQAEDLSQDVWLAALRRPPGAGRDPRAWLATVARNLLRQRHRREGQRRGREAAAARDERLPSTSELTARVSVQREVVDGVLELDEIYRQVVLLRYFEDLAPSEIARRMGVPLATVKTRLRRALALLREKLDHRHGADGRTWLTALAPLLPKTGGAVAASTGVMLVGTKMVVTLAAAAVVLVVGGWWFLSSVDTETSAEGLATSAMPGAEGAGSEPSTLLVGAGDVSDGRSEVDTAAAQDLPPTENVFVLAVNKRTGMPLPGAEVLVGTPEFAKEYQRRRRVEMDLDAEAGLRRSVTPLVCDESGLVLVPRRKGGFLVGRHGNLWGERWYGYGTEDEPLRLEMDRDQALTIQVVDEEGTPVAGVPVGVGVRGERFDHVQWSAETKGEDGSVTLPHVFQEVGRELTRDRWLFAALAVIQRDAVEVTLDPDELPQDPIRFTLLKTGRVVVYVQDENGQPLEGFHGVYVTPLSKDTLHPGDELRGERRIARTRRGRAVFPHVEPGLTLRVALVEPDAFRYVEMEGPGPAAPGQEVEFTLRIPQARHLLEGTLVDDAGHPLRNESVTLSYLAAEPEEVSRRGEVRFRTGGKGTFESSIASEAPTLQDVELSLRPAEGNARLAMLGTIQTSLEGVTNLGEVRMELLPLVARGRVVDAAGQPVYWATVRTKVKMHRSGRPFAPGDGDEPYWNHVNEYMVQSDRQGAFEIRGRHRPGQLVIFADKEEYLDSEPISYVLGEKGIELVLHEEGMLAGAILVDEDIPASWFVVEVESDLGPASVWWSGSETFVPNARVREDGSFQVGNLHPGPSRVHVRPWRDSRPLVTIDDVAIGSGETKRDPRLQPLDLRGRVRRIGVEVVGIPGSPSPKGHVAIRDDEEKGASAHHVRLTEGRASFITRETSVDLEIHAAGYRTETLEAVSRDVKVVLRPGIPVRICLPENVELPDSPLELRIGMLLLALGNRPYDEDIRSVDGKTGGQWERWRRQWFRPFGPGREVDLALPSEGTYRVGWMVAEADESGPGAGIFWGPRNQYEVSVADRGTPLVLNWGPDPRTYARELARAAEGR